MNPERRALLALAAAATVAPAFAQSSSGLAAPRSIDAVVVNKQSGALLLALFIDQPLGAPGTKVLAMQKIEHYASSIHRPEFRARFPEAKFTIQPTLELFFSQPRGGSGAAALREVEVHASNLGFVVVLSPQP